MSMSTDPPASVVGAFASLTPQLYEELRILAHAHLRREREGHTLGTTALVHEAWLRFAQSHGLADADASRFFAIAATTMRRVLIDHARRVKSAKRGDGIPAAALDEQMAVAWPEAELDELVALDEALERLAAQIPRAAQVVELRFFGGLSEPEAAQALGVSLKTVQRDWAAARAWLRKEVARDLGLMAAVDGAPTA